MVQSKRDNMIMFSCSILCNLKFSFSLLVEIQPVINFIRYNLQNIQQLFLEIVYLNIQNYNPLIQAVLSYLSRQQLISQQVNNWQIQISNQVRMEDTVIGIKVSSLPTRQYLNQLVTQYMDRNEQLSEDNFQLQQQQRKLLQLLQTKDQQILAIKQQLTQNQTINHQLYSVQKNESTKMSFHNEYQNNQTLLQKDQQILNLRQYYTNIFDQLQSENAEIKQKNKEIQSNLQAKIQKLEMQLMEKIRQESCDKQKHFESEIQKNTNTIEHLEGQIQILQILLQDKENKLNSANQAIISFKENIKNNNIQIAQLRTNINSMQSKMENFKNERLEANARIQELQNMVLQSQKQCKQALENHQQKSKLILQIEEQRKQQNESHKRNLGQLYRKLDENSNLETSINHQQNLISSLHQEIEQLTKQNQESANKIQQQATQYVIIQQNLQKKNQYIITLKKELENIKKDKLNLQSHYSDSLLQLEGEKQQKERLNLKISKEAQKKEKLILQSKKQKKDLYLKIESQQTQIQSLIEEIKQKNTQITNIKLLNKEQINKATEQKDKVKAQSKLIMEELSKMEKRMQNLVTTVQAKNQGLVKQNYTLNQQCKLQGIEKQHLRKAIQQAKVQIGRLRQDNDKKNVQISLLRQTINSCEIEMQVLKSTVDDLRLLEPQRNQLQGYKKQIMELKAKLNHSSEAIYKLKDNNADLSDKVIESQNMVNSLQSSYRQLQKSKNSLKQQKDLLQNDFRQLEIRLKENEKKLLNTTPYLNNMVEEKKNQQLENQKLSNELKKTQQLLQLCKKTKAEEIFAYNQQINDIKRKNQEYSQEMKEAKDIIQRFNREKVNIFRQNTMREDQFKKIQKSNKAMKLQITKLHSIIEDYEKQLENVSAILLAKRNQM